MNRRRFLLRAQAGLGTAAVGRLLDAQSKKSVAVVMDAGDTVASAPPSQWALKQLRNALAQTGTSVRLCQQIQEVKPGELAILISSFVAPHIASSGVLSGGTTDAESLAIFETQISGRKALAAAGADP